jgi:uncharacterized membrane protein
MFYTKNVPGWERLVRILMGVAGLAFAAANWSGSAPAMGIGIMAAMLAVTGLVGFCPMCALFGRRQPGKGN